jgi:hypothetical protein
MSRRVTSVALLGTVVALFFANSAVAGPGTHGGDRLLAMKRLSPVEKAQYSSSGSGNGVGSNDCWDLYQTNCPAPRETHPIQDLDRHSGNPGGPNPVYGGGGPAAGLNSGGAHLYPGGAPALHDFGGAGAGFHGLGTGGVPATPGFMADAPAFHSFGGAEGFHGFGGGQGFHGGVGGAFSVGGHGGIGHR